jgi:hypothetical protein
MWAGLALIILLIFLSIYGAFLGAERAERFFNRVPLAVFWTALGLALIIAPAAFRRLAGAPGLLLMHVGCILVIAGAMWGSRAGHALQRRFFGIDKIRTGRMAIYEGDSENHVVLEDGRTVRELPFSIRLKDFRIEYYKPQHLQIRTSQGQSRKVPVEIGAEFSLGPGLGTAKIVRAFENFKISTEGDKPFPYDDPRPGFNPALEVQVTKPEREVVTRYAFDPERFPGHIYPEDEFLLSYHRVISDYISELQIIRDNKVVTEKDIEVNHPLGFGGYDFYQQDYDHQAGQYTLLSVSSDTGLLLVFAGYWMLCVGVFWHLWLRHIFTGIRSKSK